MSAPTPRRRAQLTRRRFVALAGAGLAAVTAGVAARSAGAAAPAKSAAAKPKKPAATPAPAATTAHEKEFERQKTGTLGIVKTIRAYSLPPGGELPVVFKPLRTPKKER